MNESIIERKIRAFCFATTAAIGVPSQSPHSYMQSILTALHEFSYSDADVAKFLDEILSGNRSEMEHLVRKWTDEFGFQIQGDPLGIAAELRAWLGSQDKN